MSRYKQELKGCQRTLPEWGRCVAVFRSLFRVLFFIVRIIL